MLRSDSFRDRGLSTSRGDFRRSRSGFSLLEVLVASAILVFALSGIAAILPAAGSIVADGVAQDRAGLLAANALAELRSRDLFRASTYAGGKSIVLGVFGSQMAWATGSFTFAPLLGASGTTFFAATWPYNSSTNIEDCRGFFLEDDLSIDTDGAPPSFGYEAGNIKAGTAIGPRQFKRGASYGVIVTPTNAAPQPGDVATLSIATFRKPSDAAVIGLTIVSGSTNVFSLPPGNQTVVKTYFPAGSFFLAMPTPTSSATQPTWFRVASSWTARSGTSFVMVNARTPALASYETMPGSALTQVVGFAAILRVDQFPLTLK